MKTEMTVVGRNTQLGVVWLRTPLLDGLAHKILTLPDEILPRGMKTATKVVVEWNGKVSTKASGYYADVKVLEDVSDERPRPTEDN